MSGTLPPRASAERRSLRELLAAGRQGLSTLWARQVQLRHAEARTLDDLLVGLERSAAALEDAAAEVRREVAALRQEHGDLRIAHAALRRDHTALDARVTALEAARAGH